MAHRPGLQAASASAREQAVTRYEIDIMPVDQLREWVAELVESLDELDAQDFFGREGWRRTLLGEFNGNSRSKKSR